MMDHRGEADKQRRPKNGSPADASDDTRRRHDRQDSYASASFYTSLPDEDDAVGLSPLRGQDTPAVLSPWGAAPAAFHADHPMQYSHIRHELLMPMPPVDASWPTSTDDLGASRDMAPTALARAAVHNSLDPLRDEKVAPASDVHEADAFLGLSSASSSSLDACDHIGPLQAAGGLAHHCHHADAWKAVGSPTAAVATVRRRTLSGHAAACCGPSEAAVPSPVPPPPPPPAAPPLSFSAGKFVRARALSDYELKSSAFMPPTLAQAIDTPFMRRREEPGNIWREEERKGASSGERAVGAATSAIRPPAAQPARASPPPASLLALHTPLNVKRNGDAWRQGLSMSAGATRYRSISESYQRSVLPTASQHHGKSPLEQQAHVAAHTLPPPPPWLAKASSSSTFFHRPLPPLPPPPPPLSALPPRPALPPSPPRTASLSSVAPHPSAAKYKGPLYVVEFKSGRSEMFYIPSTGGGDEHDDAQPASESTSDETAVAADPADAQYCAKRQRLMRTGPRLVPTAEHASGRVALNDWVIVEADRGEDLGRVSGIVTLAWLQAQMAHVSTAAATGGVEDPAGSDGEATRTLLDIKPAPLDAASTAVTLEDMHAVSYATGCVFAPCVATPPAFGGPSLQDTPAALVPSHPAFTHAYTPVFLSPKELLPKRVYRWASPSDLRSLTIKGQEEALAVIRCLARVRARRLAMDIVDAEYQWDRNKLTFYFSSYQGERIDFRDLVRELFRIYKTRIWMCAVEKRGGGQTKAVIHPAPVSWAGPSMPPMTTTTTMMMMMGHSTDFDHYQQQQHSFYHMDGHARAASSDWDLPLAMYHGGGHPLSSSDDPQPQPHPLYFSSSAVYSSQASFFEPFSGHDPPLYAAHDAPQGLYATAAGPSYAHSPHYFPQSFSPSSLVHRPVLPPPSLPYAHGVGGAPAASSYLVPPLLLFYPGESDHSHDGNESAARDIGLFDTA